MKSWHFGYFGISGTLRHFGIVILKSNARNSFGFGKCLNNSDSANNFIWEAQINFNLGGIYKKHDHDKIITTINDNSEGGIC